MKHLLFCCTLLTLSRATNSYSCTKPIFETFGNEAGNPLIQQGTKAPVIDGIDFTEWVVGRPEPIIIPASPPNVIGVSLIGRLLGGGLTLYPSASFYAVQTVKAFDLDSTYYGCFVTSGVGSGLAATPCNVTVSGYTLDQKTQVSEKEFSYSPASLVGAKMQKKEFGKLKGLTNVTFQIESAGIVPVPVVVLVLDNVTLSRCY